MIFLCVCSRQSLGALCDGSQQVSNPRPGLPDGGERVNGSGSYCACAAATLHPAQPRLPEAAENPGYSPAGGEAGGETVTHTHSTAVVKSGL